MILLWLLAILIVPYIVLTLLGKGVPRFSLSNPKRMRVGLSILFALTGAAHFFVAEGMAKMIPELIPSRVEIVYLTGVLELLAVAGLWIPRFVRLTGIALILMLLSFLHVNIYSAFAYIDIGGHGAGPIYLLARIPFQFLLIAWTYLATEQSWFK